ncbi:probable LRR receptor-like serine/threonine-protein kinase At5g59680 isoform X2 [Brassica napus]|uniref:probable LRR receptor-like serine/threonine-protein kinase At5g59680 isoform X2 n=1 Tax=Brassica napus TaxID=3708 RepID=UPI0020786793|nr:probable LRR receptor-like serine/threonine-protein kinase At5g59680 isoform X2 [Brassica napus]
MESHCRVLELVLGTLAIIHLVLAQDQQGFISLDCGLPAEELSPYDERWTGLRFTSDATYIQRGKTGRIQANRESEFSKPYTTLRYFPNGTRNCYNLSVEKGRKYLVRATFVYGNYDGLNIKPKFDLYLGPNPWTTIDLQGEVDSGRVEMFHIPTSNSLQICLVKNGATTPLISTLEIRPIVNNTYTPVSGSLNLLFRTFLNKSETEIRYPSDRYDRVWTWLFRNEWTQIYTTLQVNNLNDVYVPPEAALTTAATPTNTNSPLMINWTSRNVDNQYYLYTHFAEIQELRTNDTREFNMTWNGEHYYGPLVPPKFNGITVFSRSGKSCKGGECSLQLKRTNRSTLPPLLNALEVYTVIHFPQSETNENEVVSMQNIKTTYGISRISWQGDPCVPQRLMWDGLNCSNTDMSTPPRITYLNLSSSGLTGTIAASIQNLTQLETLDLSNNNLTGDVPEFLGNMKSLVFINISRNDLSGSIPQALQRKGLELYPQGNPRLCFSGSCLLPKPKPFPVAIVASLASVAIILVLLVLTFVLRKKMLSIVGGRPPFISSSVNVTNANPPVSSIQTNKRRFVYSEVTNMTNNFQRVVGEGGFGIVYHGTLNVNKQVAVKLLSQSSTQGYKQFKAEVDLLMRVHHTNLVNLVGYCNEGDNLALIYEYMPNGDLRHHLSGKGDRSIINWGIRLRIALEAALGLEYLHIGCIPAMVHRDVKTTNILLDEQFKARLADFGLSRSFPVGGESHVSTMIAGTPGYLDPQYYRTSRLTEKSDVYSFGIVLLEMITNQPVIDQSREKSHITQWVEFELISGDIRTIMDPNLQGDYDSHSAWRVLDLAMSCANPSSTKRPSMSQVVVELKECLASENSRRNMRRGRMESHSPAKVSMLIDTGMLPVAR